MPVWGVGTFAMSIHNTSISEWTISNLIIGVLGWFSSSLSNENKKSHTHIGHHHFSLSTARPASFTFLLLVMSVRKHSVPEHVSTKGYLISWYVCVHIHSVVYTNCSFLKIILNVSKLVHKNIKICEFNNSIQRNTFL